MSLAPYSGVLASNPQLPNPHVFPARSIAEASAQFQVRDPTVEREGAGSCQVCSVQEYEGGGR